MGTARQLFTFGVGTLVSYRKVKVTLVKFIYKEMATYLNEISNYFYYQSTAESYCLKVPNFNCCYLINFRKLINQNQRLKRSFTFNMLVTHSIKYETNACNFNHIHIV